VYTNHVSLGQHFKPGDTCNDQVYSPTDGDYLPFPIGAIVLDWNAVPRTCHADETFSYSNGKYTP